MTVSERVVGDAIVLEVAGAVVCGKEEGMIARAVQRQLDAGRRIVVVNLGDVSSMDAAGLGALAGAYRAAREAGCDLRLACIPKRIHYLLGITRLIILFETFDSVEEAAAEATDSYHCRTTRRFYSSRSARLATASDARRFQRARVKV